jgi:hypothetical protein
VRPLWFAVGLAIPVAALALVLGFRGGPDNRGADVERLTYTTGPPFLWRRSSQLVRVVS